MSITGNTYKREGADVNSMFLEDASLLWIGTVTVCEYNESITTHA